MKLTHYIKKIALWFIGAYFFGYIVGALFVSILWGPHPYLYLVGLSFSLVYTATSAGPIFLLMLIPYYLFNKRLNIKESYVDITVLALIVATTSSIAMPIAQYFLSGTYQPMDKLDILAYGTLFLGTFFGIVLPRVIFKQLKPGKIFVKE